MSSARRQLPKRMQQCWTLLYLANRLERISLWYRSFCRRCLKAVLASTFFLRISLVYSLCCYVSCLSDILSSSGHPPTIHILNLSPIVVMPCVRVKPALSDIAITFCWLDCYGFHFHFCCLHTLVHKIRRGFSFFFFFWLQWVDRRVLALQFLFFSGFVFEVVRRGM